jgi:hypothetical protein
MLDKEIKRIEELHPSYHHIIPDRSAAILGEEFGEVCRAVLEINRYPSDIQCITKLRAELIQVAATAIQWAEALIRREMERERR